MKSTVVDESLSSINPQFCSRENQLLQIFIHVMLNDICLPCCHLPKTLFHDSPVHFDPYVPISTQIIVTVYQKLH